MKCRKLYLLPLLLLIATLAFSQTEDSTVVEPPPVEIEVPKPVLKAFGAQYKGELWDWAKEGEVYVASFLNEEVASLAYYNKSGDWIETRTETIDMYLPGPAPDILFDKYAKYDFDRVEQVADKDNPKYFLATLYDEDTNEWVLVRFDESGAFKDESRKKVAEEEE